MASNSRRARSGCLTCRRRKVKCDEQQPNCYNCSRLRKVPSTVINSYSNATFSESEFVSQSSFEFASGSNVDSYRDASLTVSIAPNFLSMDSGSSLTFTQSGGDFGSVNSLEDIDLPVDFSLEDPVVASTPVFLEARRFSYFLEHVEPPFITPTDSINWARMRRHMAELGSSNSVVASAISSLEALYEAMANGQDITNATSLYYAAKSSHTQMLEDERQDMQVTLTVTFLLCCFEIVAQQDTVSITLKSEGAFIKRLQQWALQRPWPPVARRIEAWLMVIHAKALHLGGRGLLAPKVHSLLLDNAQSIPCLSLLDHHLDPTTALYDSISSSLFEFFFDTQKLSMQISGLNRHHRSRGFPADEIEVQLTADAIRRHLSCLWQQRPSVLKLSRDDLRGHISEGLVDIITKLICIYNAVYFTEVVYLGRAHGQWPSATPEAQEAMQQIRQIVDNCSTADEVKLDSGYMWPLFIYAVESTEQEGAAWAVEKLRQIRNPVCRSDFVAQLVQALTEEQRKKGERVDSRYFSIEKFGIAPPFI
ncbi:fungal-specific transcription factor domain-containing protein [Lipomyces starkeyi]